MKKTIEEKITDYYVSGEDGDWLVEKGKVKEARLIKEAYTRLIDLQADNDYLRSEERAVNRKALNNYYESLNSLGSKLEVMKERAFKAERTAERIISNLKDMTKIIQDYEE